MRTDTTTSMTIATLRRTALHLMSCTLSGLSCLWCVFAMPARANEDLLFEGATEGAVASASVVIEGLRPDASLVYSGDELRLRGYRTLGEALVDVVGVWRQVTSRGPRYGMRGTLDGLGLEIDGIPQAVDGERDVLDVDRGLNIDDIESVEIIRGPVSAMNGVEALAGLVRVTTRKTGEDGARVRLEGTMISGARGEGLPPNLGVVVGPAWPNGPLVSGERAASGDAGFTLGPMALFAIAHGREGQSRTYALDDVPLSYVRVGGATLPGARRDVIAPVGHEKSGTLRLAAAVGPVRADLSFAHVDETMPVSRVTHGLLLDAPDRAVRNRARFRVFSDLEAGPFRVSTAAFAGAHQRTDVIHLYPARASFPAGGSVDIDSTLVHAGGRARVDMVVIDGHQISAGAFAEGGRLEASADVRSPRDGARTTDVVSYQELAGSFMSALEYQGDFGFGLHLVVGAAVRARTAFEPTLVPRAALSWVPHSMLGLRLAYGEGTRTSDRYDLAALAPLIVVDGVNGIAEAPLLRPEHARTVEAGLRFSPSSTMRLDVVVFGTRHEDAIEDRVQNGSVAPANLDPRHIVGGEAMLLTDPLAELLHIELGISTAYNVYGPDLDTDHVRVRAAVECALTDMLLVGMRGRSLWLIETAERMPSATIDFYGAIHTFDDRVRFLVGLQNALDAREKIPDRAVLPNAPPLSLSAPGRTFTLAIEGRL
jgi:outer membrane receptor protein involved in Fe transport